MHLVDGDAAPVEPAFQFLAERIAEFRVGVDGALRLLGFVLEHPAPARKAANENGLRMLISRVSASGEVCGTAPG